MPFALYVGLQDDDRVAVFTVDADSDRLTRQSDVPVKGPSAMAVAADRRTLYVGGRGGPAIATFRIGAGAALTPVGEASQPHAPTFLALDRSGKFMLVAYYQGGGAAVYRVEADGAVGTASQLWLATDTGAHAIATDPSNHFAFVPHISRVQDNVLEPPKNIPGPNVIMQFRFDAQTGHLTPNSPVRVEQPDLTGPRHYCFHPNLDIAYFSNEQGCSVTVYRLDRTAGTLTAAQTISTLPAGFTARNTCSQIHLTPSASVLYVGNRGHNSIAGFAVDPATGLLTSAGHVETEAVPSAFCVDPSGNFVLAAGTATGRLASYRINGATGALTPLAVEAVGRRPAALAAVPLGD
jgi:6-phosphogluconolactonase (cycloisomerase 2 family)